MKYAFTLVPLGLLALAACATSSTVGTVNTTQASLNKSPAGVAALGFVDILTPVPGVLPGGSFAGCVSVTGDPLTTSGTLTLTACPSRSGGTLTGPINVTVPAAGQFVLTFANLVDTTTPSPVWTYNGSLGVDLLGSTGATIQTGATPITLVSSDPTGATPSKTWTFTASLTVTVTSPGTYALSGTYTFASATDSVSVTITAPLVFGSGTNPASGTLSVTDTITGQSTPETVTLTFTNGQVAVS